MDGSQLELGEPLQPPRRPLHPAGERRAIEMHAMTGQDLHLTVQRREPGELRDHHMGHQRSRGHAVLDQPRQRLGLYHCAFTAPAGIFGTYHAQHPQDRRNDVEYLADVLADLVQQALATRTGGRLRFDHLLAPRQVLRQRANVALRLLARLAGRTRRLARRMIIVGGNRRRHVGSDIIKIERELIGDDCGKLLRSRAEHHVLEGIDDGSQPIILGIE
jgi:hypothetical protein